MRAKTLGLLGLLGGGVLNCNSPSNLYEDPFWRTRLKQPVAERPESEFIIFSGNSNIPLAREIADLLGTKLGDITVSRFSDGEVRVQVLEHVRGRDTYVIQSTCPPVNEHLMELLLIISTLRRASVKKITAIIPYYGYARQDRKMSSRVPISAADVSKLIEIMGVDRVIACDLHCGQIQGFFGPRIPVDNLMAGIVAVPHFQSIDLINPVIISPDAGGVYRAKTFLGFLTTPSVIPGLAMIIKQRAAANQVERMDLVGSVEGADCIIVDDLIDTAGTLCEAAAQLKKHGAKRVYAFATHGLFSRDALTKIHNSPLEQVIVTNTIPLPGTDKESSIAHLKPKCEGPTSKIKQLSVAMLLAESIRRSHQKESLSQLFYPKGFKGE